MRRAPKIRSSILGPSALQRPTPLSFLVAMVGADPLLLRPVEAALVFASWDRRIPDQDFRLGPWLGKEDDLSFSQPQASSLVA